MGIVRTALKVIAAGGIGVIFMAIEKTLYDQGVMINEFATGTISLTDIQIITLLIWVLIGVFVAVITD